MKKINYLSDLKIVESYPTTEDFIYHFSTDNSCVCYDVSLELGNCSKAKDEEGKDVLIIALDNHGLGEGQLKVRRELNYTDDDFPDKVFNKVTENRYDIYLVDGESDEVEPIEVDGYIPIFRGWSAYEVAVKNGFVGTEQEWLDSLKAKPYKSISEYVYNDGTTDLAINPTYVATIVTQWLTLTGTDTATLQSNNASLALTSNANLTTSFDTNGKINLTSKEINLKAPYLGRAYDYVNVKEGAVEISTEQGGKFTYNGKDVATTDLIPTPQKGWDEYTTGNYIYSNTWVNGGNNDKVVPSIKSAIEQHNGNLKMRWWLWGDKNNGKVWGDVVPVASSAADGAMSKEDKIKLDGIDTSVFATNAALNKVGQLALTANNNATEALETKQDKLNHYSEDDTASRISYTDENYKGNLIVYGGGLQYQSFNNNTKAFYTLECGLEEFLGFTVFKPLDKKMSFLQIDCESADINAQSERFLYNKEQVATLCGLTKEAFEDILAYNLTLQILGAEDDNKLTQTLITSILA